jgi:hypothetical protein
LLTLAAVHDGMSRENASSVDGMDRQTLRDWVHRFNAKGAVMPQGPTARSGIPSSSWTGREHSTDKFKVPNNLTNILRPLTLARSQPGREGSAVSSVAMRSPCRSPLTASSCRVFPSSFPCAAGGPFGGVQGWI